MHRSSQRLCCLSRVIKGITSGYHWYLLMSLTSDHTPASSAGTSWGGEKSQIKLKIEAQNVHDDSEGCFSEYFSHRALLKLRCAGRKGGVTDTILTLQDRPEVEIREPHPVIEQLGSQAQGWFYTPDLRSKTMAQRLLLCPGAGAGQRQGKHCRVE